MDETKVVKIIATMIRSRKSTAIVIGPNQTFLNTTLLATLDEVLQETQRSRRGELIELHNGSRALFMTAATMEKVMPGIIPDLVWIHGAISPMHRAYLTSRTLAGSAVLIETE